MRNRNGITMVALIITIIIMLILASVAIKQISGDGVVKKAELAKLMVDYQTVKTDLGMYKLSKETLSITGEEITDESLIGTVYKRVFVADTCRELAVIVDFNEIDSKPTYGKGGNKLLKQDNNDKTTIKETDTLYDLRDVYAIDLADGSFYYINGNQIYTLDGEMVEVEENETTSNKYAVETINQEYIQKRKFITKWNVTLGETEGSETYSTVVLPVYSVSTYDATIYWGDGTSTVLQHRINGVTLTNEELIAKVTHNYTLADSDDGIRTIEILGTYTNFRMDQTHSSATKLKLIGLEQWGNIGITALNFKQCTNLGGGIPTPLEDSFKSLIYLSFQECSNLQGPIPEGLLSNTGKITSLSALFYKCSNLEGPIPSTLLEHCVDLTNVGSIFESCTKIDSIPEGLFKNCSKLTNVSKSFAGTSVSEIPSNLFDNNNGQPNVITNMAGVFRQTKITSIPQGLFNLCTEVTIFGGNVSSDGLFLECKLLQTIPENLFKYNTKVKHFGWLFRGCSSLKEIPVNLFANCPKVQDFRGIFNGCINISEIPENLFVNNIEVLHFYQTFLGCTGITEIPENLFANCTLVQNFEYVFKGCSNIKGSIPENLFKNNTEVTTFMYVFSGCSSITGIVPRDLFKYNTKIKSFQDAFGGCINLQPGEVYITAPDITDFRGFGTGGGQEDNLITTIYIPANSTSYNTYVAYYGAEKVVTY